MRSRHALSRSFSPRRGFAPFALCVALAAGVARAADPPAGDVVKLMTQHGYLPNLPVLVRVEVLTSQGLRDWSLWDGEAVLSADAGVSLSTNRVPMRNGMGSALVSFSGGGDFSLTAQVGTSLQATRALVTVNNMPVTLAGGTLAVDTVWSGVVLVTNDVTVPTAVTLTILSNTLVVINGVASGTAANDLFVNGTLNSLGTEADPVTITCAQAGLRWGQIRHDRASLATAPTSTYRYTSITRAGRATGEGHTGTAPVIRPTNARLVFESCNITDHAETAVPRTDPAYGTPGKIGSGSGSDLTFIDCLFQRARMGPEVAGTALLCSNTCIMEMNGPDDGDGIYIHDQSAGQQVIFTGCVIARGDDDGIDTLGSIVTVENCIIREWNNLFEDAKGISVLNGAVHVRRSLIVDATVGIAAKSGGGTPSATPVLVTINSSTITGCLTNVLANRKSSSVGPNVHLNITNCVLWGGDPVHSDFEPTSSDSTNFTIRYCNLSDPYAGTGNLLADPLFVDAAAYDFRLQPFSPCIDAGDPLSPPDPDGSRADMGYSPFFAPTPVLSEPQRLPDGSFQFALNAYTNRDYLIEACDVLPNWTALKTNLQTSESTLITDATATNSPQRFYRARVTFSPATPPPPPPGPATISFIAYTNVWKYEQTGNFDGAAWMAGEFGDSTWPSGPGVLAVTGTGSISEPVRTPLTLGRITYYFRTAFMIPANVTVTNLTGSHFIDDGAVVYVNGREGYRYNMGSTNITYNSLAAGNLSGAPGELGFSLPVTNLVSGVNVLAVEVHQSSAGSSDIYMGLKLDGLVSTNAP